MKCRNRYGASFIMAMHGWVVFGPPLASLPFFLEKMTHSFPRTVLPPRTPVTHIFESMELAVQNMEPSTYYVNAFYRQR
jgi:hypothetical protein